MGKESFVTTGLLCYYFEDMNSYELMLIYNPILGEGEVQKHFGTVKEKIESFGGKVVSEDVWGLKDLAYAMNKFKQAYYIVLTFDLDALKVIDLNDYLNKQQTHIIRSMTTLLEANDE